MFRTSTRGLRLVPALAGLALVAGACGSGTPGQPAGGADDDIPEGAVVVDFWQNSFQDVENDWYTAAVDEYNASQDEVFIKLTQVPGDAWEQRLTAAQAAGNAPDMYTMNYGGVLAAAQNSQLAPMSDYVDDEVWSDIQESVLGSVTMDGTHYAFPMLVEPSAVLWYRTDLFDAAGIDGPPTTWDELEDYAAQLTTDGVYGFGAAQVAPDMGWSTCRSPTTGARRRSATSTRRCCRPGRTCTPPGRCRSRPCRATRTPRRSARGSSR
jgi:multiple sugar transport system substrate-binding protein